MSYLYLILIIYFIPLIAYFITFITYKKYDNIDNKKSISGFEVARNILDKNNLEKIYIVEKRGLFTDKYDEKQNVIRLSTPAFHNETIYSLAISSYIATKAQLYNKNNKMVKTKVIFDGFIDLLTSLLYILLLIGIIINSISIYKTVLYLFIFILLYKIITIYIEDKIIEQSIKELIKNKYISNNNKEIKKLYDYLKINNISQMVLSLSDLYYNFKDNIK